MAYKLIIDTSALHEIHNTLPTDKIKKAYESGQIELYCTPILLSEFFNYLDQSFQKHIHNKKKFLDIPWHAIFNDLSDIFTYELSGKITKGNLFLDKKDYTNIKDTIDKILRGGTVSENDKAKLQKEKHRREQINKYSKDCFIYARTNLKNNGIFDNESFNNYLTNNFEYVGEEKIINCIKSIIPKDRLVKYWKENRQNCIYFNKYVEGWLFTAYHNLSSNNKIDINWEADMQHILYLNYADGIVSEERNFMKKLCNRLFPKKDYLSVADLASKL